MPVIDVAVFIIGLCVGSFLNVCRVRIPAEESIVMPRSFCRDCKRAIAWYDNIPLVSFVILRGRCRHCYRPIPWMYPVVELVTAILALAVWRHTMAPIPTLLYMGGLIAPLILISAIDIDHLIIPDVISLPAIPLGIAIQLYLAPGPWVQVLQTSLVGILVGAGSLAVVSLSYEWLRKKEGLGWGDVKLMAWLGVYFGWQGCLVILLVASVLGTLVGGIYLLATHRDRSHPIPFGPFLAGAGILYYFYGDPIVAWYIGTLAI